MIMLNVTFYIVILFIAVMSVVRLFYFRYKWRRRIMKEEIVGKLLIYETQHFDLFKQKFRFLILWFK